MIGIALVDSTEQRMSLCEFVDDEYFSNTEALIVQLAAKECILMSEKNYEMDKLKKVFRLFGQFNLINSRCVRNCLLDLLIN